MGKQFLRIYALLFLTIALVLVGFGELYDALLPPAQSPQISVDVLIAHIQQNPTLVQHLATSDVSFPSSLWQQLQKGEVVTLQLQGSQQMYYQLQQTRLIQLGPFDSPIAKASWWYEHFAMLVYSVLALLLLLLLSPIARDLLRIKKATLQFAKRPQVLMIGVKPTSSMYPLAKTLHDMSARIFSVLKTQKDLSNMVAHEVRTPLSRMEFLLEKVSPHLEEQDVQRFKRDIDQIEALVSNYLLFARVEYQHQFDIQLQHLAPESFLQPLTERFQERYPRLQLDTQLDIADCRFDSSLMDILLTNLLNNAARYAKQQIQLHWQQQDGINQICVADDGPGFPQNQLAKLDAFCRHAQHSDDKGFGLGLYIVRLIIQRHQGELQVKANGSLGGACFRVRWPNTSVN